jgi:hypothetical protein
MPKFTQSPVKRPPRRPAIFAPVFSPLLGGSLDKLAPQVTSSSVGRAFLAQEDALTLTSVAFSEENFGKRARVKFLTQAMAVGLANVRGSQLHKAYWNTFYCSSTLQERSDGKRVAKFCKNRWCLVCCRIRSAKLIKQYAPLLQSWPEKHLVTLTVPNCSRADLEATVEHMKAGFDTIRRGMAMQHRRKQRAAPLVALRKLEATHNPDSDTYHPHFHLVVPDLASANELRAAWLGQFPSAQWKGQDVRPANAGAAHELFKYFTKLITTQSKERFIRLEPLNVIFEAIAGGRTFQVFGIQAPKVDEELVDEAAEALADELNIIAVWEWVQAVGNWVNKETGEMLTNYTPSPEWRNLVETKMVYNSNSKIVLNEVGRGDCSLNE